MRHTWTAVDRAMLWLGAGICATTVGLSVVALWVRASSEMPPVPNRFGMSDPVLVGFVVLDVVYAGVALVITRRLPRNVIAWLLAGIGLSYAISMLAVAVVFETAGSGGTITGPEAAWLSQAGALVAGVMTTVFILVFPDPRAIPVAARPVAIVIALAISLPLALLLVHPGPLYFAPQIDNPFGFGPMLTDLTADITGLSIALTAVVLLTAGWIVWRYRTTRGIERLQLKWFVSASVITLTAFVVVQASRARVAVPDASDRLLLLLPLASTLVPIAVGIAILRYDLYAIDRIINRAIVYSALTTGLAVSFAVTITALGTFARLTLIGSEGGDTIIVAVSTLIVAALFNPLRSRLQSAVDRRFDRARYDATRTVDAFGERLRRTLDLEELEGEMLDVVERALRPRAAGVWLAGAEPTEGQRQAVRA